MKNSTNITNGKEKINGRILEEAKEIITETIEWFDDRFYKITKPDGGVDYYPSVTTALGIINKPWLTTWYGDNGTERAKHKSRLAKEKGSLIHQAIYDLLQKGYVSSEGYKQEDYFQVWNFLQFYNSLNPEVLLNEVTVLSHTHRTAGTLDLLIKIEDGVYDVGYAKTQNLLRGNYLIDVKTGNMDDAYHYQTAAYANMCIEMELVDHIQGTGILLTDADTKKGWKLITRNPDEIAADFKCYLSALNLYQAKGEDKPKVFEMPAALEIPSIMKKYADEMQRQGTIETFKSNGKAEEVKQ